MKKLGYIRKFRTHKAVRLEKRQTLLWLFVEQLDAMLQYLFLLLQILNLFNVVFHHQVSVAARLFQFFIPLVIRAKIGLQYQSLELFLKIGLKSGET